MSNKAALAATKPSSVSILCTDNYVAFHFLKGNRDLNQLKIKRIIESVENGLNMFQYCPIMVNSDGFIIDGQHRFYVCKTLGLPVYYVIVPNFSLRQVAEINQNASKWTDKDFLNCWIDIGIDHYKTLKEFIEKYQVNIGIAISILSEGKVKAKCVDDFRDGLFKVNFPTKAHALMHHALSYKDYCESYKSRNFLQALEILGDSKEYDRVLLIEKLKSHKLVVESRQSPKEYLTHLEDLFNYHNSKRKRIY